MLSKVEAVRGHGPGWDVDSQLVPGPNPGTARLGIV